MDATPTPSRLSPTAHNPMWGYVVAFRSLAVGLGVVAAAGGVAAAVFWRSDAHGGVRRSAAEFALFMGGGLAAFTWLLNLMAVSMARAADRTFDAFRRGERLVEWAYGPAEWRRYVAAEEGRLRRVGRAIAGLIGVPVLGIGTVAAVTANHNGDAGPIAYVVAVAAAAGGAGIGLGFNRLYIAARRRRLSPNPLAIVGPNAVYSGGDFAVWGSHGQELRSARWVEGTPAVLAFVVGPAGSGRQSPCTGGALRATGRVVSSKGDVVRRFTVPVPDGRRDEALVVLRAFEEPAVAAAEPDGVAAAPSTPAAAVATRPAGPRVAVWWWATVAAFVGGLALMVVGDKATATAALGVGFLVFCLTPVTALVATVKTIRRRRPPPRTPGRV